MSSIYTKVLHVNYVNYVKMPYAKTPDTQILNVPIYYVKICALNAVASANSMNLPQLLEKVFDDDRELMLELQQQIRFIEEKRAKELRKYAQPKQ